MDPNDDDINEEQEHIDHLIRSAAAITVAAVAVAVALDDIERQPYRGEPLRGLIETERIIGVFDYTCRDQIRMNRSAFFNLCELVRERGLLGDSVHVSMEEKLCIFLNTIGHNAKNRQLVHNFGRSGHTISQYFNEALNAILKLYPILLKPPSTQTPQQIRDKPRQYYPYFKDCVGAIDGSHVPAWVPVSDHQRFRDRKGGISQNVLAACDFEMYFTYVPEIDPLLDLDNDEEPGYNEVPTPQASYSTRRRGRPCAGSSTQQNKKKTVPADRLIDPINRLADAIVSCSAATNESLLGQRVNEAISEMYEPHEIEKMSDAVIFLMKNKWAANAILSAPKERRVYMMKSMMHPSTSNP